ncbi:hypothetical protein L226DRAFT_555066 [Lentinus tigrinus ALCF2SS1-7]|uniref:Uncharacterized protein n=1 Tax=Lentinus tigrinus ALCF2SS1-6 TaxID=1328759 RepID=A0A5C2RTM7_9APHY|nr:hypothetical protein L227DRAFT_588660 [Lentinus tigrinus ALCF2SS1-6]RPD69695.1 hypothetical protein L226DRAFT_555066 [Lentinus tigrinus ALCF2SS1-7]
MTAQVETLSYSAPGPTTKRPYPSRPYAAGLQAVRRCSDDWSPPWKVFPLKAFRGSSYTFLKIQANWDDADLLRELSNSIADCMAQMVLSQKRPADHTCVYPRWVGPAGVSPSKNMRHRYFLRHPEQMKDRHEFMQVLTALVYSILEKDVSSAFTAAGYMTSAYSVCLVLLGVLNFVEF